MESGAVRSRVAGLRSIGWVRAVALSIIVMPAVAWISLQVTRAPLGTVRVNGEAVPVSKAGAVEVSQQAARWEATMVSIRTGPYVVKQTRRALGAHLPTVQVIQQLQRVGRTGNPLRDLAHLWASYAGSLDLRAQPEIDRRAVAQAAMALRERVERAPVPGTRTPDGEIIEGIPGLTVNTLTAVGLLARGLSEGAERITLDFSTIAPPRPIAYDAPGTSMFTHTLTAFETNYRVSGDAWGRAANIEAAAEAIDGHIIPPGGTLSFNEVVGERTFERGFRPAKELANRRVVDGIGGGVCQVAATLHAAAFLGGFGMPVYQPHSRPSSYIETGLDTMVAWPNRDLVLRNPYPFSVRIEARAGRGTVSVLLKGAGKAHPVEWNKEVLETIPAGVQEEVSPGLSPGKRTVVQKPIDGQKLRRTRTVYLPTGPVSDELIIRYPANDRIVAVGR